MDKWTVVSIALLILVFSAVIYLMSDMGIIEREYILGTTTTTQTTSTTITTTTTATIPDEHTETEENDTLEWLERRTFDLVNVERTSRGLAPLVWNEEISEVGRMHSKDMADNDFFSHTGSDGSNSSYRLIRDNVYYWNQTGENIAKISGVYSRVRNAFGEVIEINYKSFEDIAQDTVDGWMDSPDHRANILRTEFNEAGMGIKASDDIYYLTQQFILRVSCGYKQALCCETEGYYPWCYDPWDCVDGVCN
jgi:uncharacterized protein YkwD